MGKEFRGSLLNKAPIYGRMIHSCSCQICERKLSRKFYHFWTMSRGGKWGCAKIGHHTSFPGVALMRGRSEASRQSASARLPILLIIRSFSSEPPFKDLLFFCALFFVAAYGFWKVGFWWLVLVQRKCGGESSPTFWSSPQLWAPGILWIACLGFPAGRVLFGWCRGWTRDW
jgi:hypothetical protein